MGFGCLGARSNKGGFWWCKNFAKACDLGSVGMIAWVVVLHWLRVCDYFFGSVCYKQTVFIVSLCGFVFPIVLFITVFVFGHGTKKMLIVISWFVCIYKCMFLIIIFILSSFFREKWGKVCSALLFLAKKTNLLDFNIKNST